MTMIWRTKANKLKAKLILEQLRLELEQAQFLEQTNAKFYLLSTKYFIQYCQLQNAFLLKRIYLKNSLDSIIDKTIKEFGIGPVKYQEQIYNDRLNNYDEYGHEIMRTSDFEDFDEGIHLY